MTSRADWTPNIPSYLECHQTLMTDGRWGVVGRTSRLLAACPYDCPCQSALCR
jgi:hypothetical protein